MRYTKIAGVLSALLLAACATTQNGAETSTASGKASASEASATTSSSGACVLQHDYEGKGKNKVYRCLGSKLMILPEVKAEIDPSISVSFNGGGRVVRNDLQSRPVARSFGRNEGDSCERAFVNGVIRFQQAAKKNNATRVTDLKSFAAGSNGRFERRMLPAGQFDCIVATFQSRMTMRGDVAR